MRCRPSAWPFACEPRRTRICVRAPLDRFRGARVERTSELVSDGSGALGKSGHVRAKLDTAGQVRANCDVRLRAGLGAGGSNGDS